jgi:hypothetical protein
VRKNGMYPLEGEPLTSRSQPPVQLGHKSSVAESQTSQLDQALCQSRLDVPPESEPPIMRLNSLVSVQELPGFLTLSIQLDHFAGAGQHHLLAGEGN